MTGIDNKPVLAMYDVRKLSGLHGVFAIFLKIIYLMLLPKSAVRIRVKVREYTLTN